MTRMDGEGRGTTPGMPLWDLWQPHAVPWTARLSLSSLGSLLKPFSALLGWGEGSCLHLLSGIGLVGFSPRQYDFLSGPSFSIYEMEMVPAHTPRDSH